MRTSDTRVKIWNYSHQIQGNSPFIKRFDISTSIRWSCEQVTSRTWLNKYFCVIVREPYCRELHVFDAEYYIIFVNDTSYLLGLARFYQLSHGKNWRDGMWLSTIISSFVKFCSGLVPVYFIHAFQGFFSNIRAFLVPMKWPWRLWMYQLGTPQIARFMGPTWDPPGADRTQVGPMLAPWTLLSGSRFYDHSKTK